MSVLKKAVAVVDDDEAVLDATSSFLEALGYDALAFSSGEAFLASDAGGGVSCLLTDVNMPGISGLELQDRVRQLRPALPIIMMTALTDDALRRRALAGGARELLRKPLAADDLIRCLEDTIGS
ncbi:response regulator transcription factor [Methylobacterium radiodurans]|uniref:Two-component system response regulator n=1 Tax=Methylobacterium radiodurans TaxID=2202828 RepID=A0A2U8W1C6_9HYPH|nr:response regulator [Methylobacterium radiodurans]AWN39066.1 two-component system response regulator [Methylobacterium radiodurans]